MSAYTLTIDGKGVGSSKGFEVIDPATEQPFAQAPDATREQLDQAVEAARRAFPAWSATPIAERKQALLRMAEVVQKNLNELAMLVTREQGKPIQPATGEAVGAMLWFQLTAGLELPTEVVQDDAYLRVEIRRRPLGVVGAITPWNFPLTLAAWKIAPALAAGNFPI